MREYCDSQSRTSDSTLYGSTVDSAHSSIHLKVSSSVFFDPDRADALKPFELRNEFCIQVTSTVRAR